MNSKTGFLDFLSNNRRVIYAALPGLIPTAGMAYSLMKIHIYKNDGAAVKQFYLFLALYALSFLWYLYVWAFVAALGKQNITRGLSNYLNGESFWHYENGGFLEMGRYLGHGLCYEAAAMLMLVWHDHEKTRFVYGEAYSDIYHDRVPHAWMELKAYGIWWVFDAGWESPAHPVPRLWYLFINHAKAEGIIEHREFFSHKNAKILAQAIKRPDTSMCLHKLSSFSRNLASLD